MYKGKLEIPLLEFHSPTWKQLCTSTAALPDLRQDFWKGITTNQRGDEYVRGELERAYKRKLRR